MTFCPAGHEIPLVSNFSWRPGTQNTMGGPLTHTRGLTG